MELPVTQVENAWSVYRGDDVPLGRSAGALDQQLTFSKQKLILGPAGRRLGREIASSKGHALRYLFEDYAFDTNLRELYRGADVVSVTPQVFDLLEYLIRHRARVVSKDDLINTIWNGRCVSDAALTTRLNVARNAIGDSGGEQRLIKTLPRRGFRFIGQVRAAQQPSGVEGYDNPVEAPKATLPHPDKPSVADLPNPSGDAEQEYLADLLAGSPAREREERLRREIDREIARKAALAYEKWRRDAESRKEDAARENACQRRERTIEKVQAALDKAKREHTRRVDVMEAWAQAEDARWHKQKSELENALRRARRSSKER